MNQRRDYKFSNWAGNESCVASNFFQPETEEELIALVKNSRKVRMVGTGHSWSPICLNEDTLINLDKYNKVLHLDKENKTVKVQAGVKLWQLNDYLDKNGFALTNLGSVSEQSVAGAVSTATHGSGINYQILGSQVQEFTLIKASGDKIIIHSERNKELFNKALVNLGCLGIVSEITLKIVPAFNLRDQTIVMNFEEVVEKLDELIYNTDHFKLWWFPHTDKLVVYRYTRTNEKVNDSKIRQWLMEEFISVNMYRLLLKIGSINRNWRRNINRRLVGSFIQPLDRIEKSYKVFNVPSPPLHRETEWAFDIANAKELLREYKKTIDQSQHRINFIQEIRFTKADDFTLSPSSGRNSLWLGAYNADNFGWREVLNDFEMLAKKYKGRPHWGKEFTADKSYLDSVYPGKKEFETLKFGLDPEGKFTNQYIAKIFS